MVLQGSAADLQRPQDSLHSLEVRARPVDPVATGTAVEALVLLPDEGRDIGGHRLPGHGDQPRVADRAAGEGCIRRIPEALADGLELGQQVIVID
jgi:hypothetical protein